MWHSPGLLAFNLKYVWPLAMASNQGQQVSGWQENCWVNRWPGECLHRVSWVEMWSLPCSTRKWAKGKVNLPFYKVGVGTWLGIAHTCSRTNTQPVARDPCECQPWGWHQSQKKNGLWLAKTWLAAPWGAREAKKKQKERPGQGCSQEIPWHMHVKHGCLHGGWHLQFLYMCVHVCVCMNVHVHMCWDTSMPLDAPRYPHPSAPSPELRKPRSEKIQQVLNELR